MVISQKQEKHRVHSISPVRTPQIYSILIFGIGPDRVSSDVFVKGYSAPNLREGRMCSNQHAKWGCVVPLFSFVLFEQHTFL